jgi:sialate O-acetylesterase
MISRRLSRSLAVLASVSLFATARADVRLPTLISDNMVLQQGLRAPIWGWADDGEQVTVTFRGRTSKTTARHGEWRVALNRLQPGDVDTLVVQGRNRIQITNVLVGEVWLASGQSNMEWPLNRSFEATNAIGSSFNPHLRLFHVPKKKSNEPEQDVKAHWEIAGPETTPTFSAVAYYFGRDLQKSREVPVGLIESDWGGSPAEVWMSERMLEKTPEYKRDILEKYAADAQKGGTNAPRWKPTELYNGMIAPLIPYGIKGAIWYQGESNAGRAEQYHRLFADLIRNWRQDWDGSDFTFLAVQLAPYAPRQPLEEMLKQPEESNWAELREAQLLATKTLPKVGIAVITDVGEKEDIHPRRKEPVGARLALAARGIAYREKIEYSGPVYRSLKVTGSKAILSFDHTDSGLEARDGDLKGFAVCGPDKKFVWAQALIDGDKVIVSSPDIQNPVAVRYGWANYPVVNFWNKAGLPASPFRTDDFPMTTATKKENQPKAASEPKASAEKKPNP